MVEPNSPTDDAWQPMCNSAANYCHLATDAELVAMFVETDCRAALEVLVQRHGPMVASVCRLTVDDPSIAEDAFQATFLILIKSAAKVRRRDSIAAWLHGVAYRAASRLRKQQKNASRSSSEQVPDSLADCRAVHDPLTALARKMELEALDRELETLPARLKTPLVEHYFLGFTAAEIAARLELSVSAVEGRLRRGRRVLRQQLARRGISLSVLLAGSSWFQKHLAAAELNDWTARLLLDGPTLDIASTGQSTGNTQLSNLIHQELSMWPTGTLKTAMVCGALLSAAGLLVSAMEGNIAQGQSNGRPDQVTILGRPENAAPVGQLGSLFGAGAMPPAKTEDWSQPEIDTGEPSWLAGGRIATEAIERNRQSLAEVLDPEFDSAPLQVVVDWLTEQTGTLFQLHSSELDGMGISIDVPVTIHGTASVREIIRRIGEPLDLTYVIHESDIEITSQEFARSMSNMRFYDLSFVLPNSENVPALVNAIQQTVDPDLWTTAGGTGSIAVVGSMMVVSAPDTTHQRIEVFLLNLSKMHPMNAKQAVPNLPRGVGSGLGGGGMF